MSKYDEMYSYDVLVSDQTVSDLLVTAFEGGSNYWCVRAEFNYTHEVAMSALYGPGVEGKGLNRYEVFPFLPWGRHPDKDNVWTITLVDEDEMKWVLMQTDLRDGFDRMREKYPDLYRELVRNEHLDASGADIYLQLCAMLVVVYG